MLVPRNQCMSFFLEYRVCTVCRGYGDQAIGTSEGAITYASVTNAKPREGFGYSCSDCRCSDVSHDGIYLSPLMQSYFGDTSRHKLIENLKRDRHPLQAPVVVNVKWLMDLNRSISIVYDKPVASFEQPNP